VNLASNPLKWPVIEPVTEHGPKMRLPPETVIFIINLSGVFLDCVSALFNADSIRRIPENIDNFLSTELDYAVCGLAVNAAFP